MRAKECRNILEIMFLGKRPKKSINTKLIQRINNFWHKAIDIQININRIESKERPKFNSPRIYENVIYSGLLWYIIGDEI